MGSSAGYPEDELAPFSAHSTVWPEQCRAHVDMQHYDTLSKVRTVTFMRIQVFQVVNAVSLHGWFPTL